MTRFPVVEPDQIRVRGSWKLKREASEETSSDGEARRGTEMRWCRCGEMGKISILTVELEIVFDAKKKPQCLFSWKNRIKC